MSSYCDTCRKLDVPHKHHEKDNDAGSRTTSPPAVGDRVLSTVSNQSSRSRKMGARRSAERSGKGSPQIWERLNRRGSSPSTLRRISPAARVDRDTVCSLLRQSSTPHCSPHKSEPSSDKKRHQPGNTPGAGGCCSQPQSRRCGTRNPKCGDMRQDKAQHGAFDAGAERPQSAALCEDLKEMLARLREAVRKDRCEAVGYIPDSSDGGDLCDCDDKLLSTASSYAFLNKGEMSPAQIATVPLTPESSDEFQSARKIGDDDGTNGDGNTVHLWAKISSPLASHPRDLGSAAMEVPGGDKDTVEQIPCTAVPMRGKDSEIGNVCGNRSSNVASSGENNDSTLGHVEMLRAGLVELCGAVREDLHALYARVDDLQRQQQRQQTVLDNLVQEHSSWKCNRDDATEVISKISYKKLLAELQHYTVNIVHKFLNRQRCPNFSQGATGAVATDNYNGHLQAMPITDFALDPELCSDKGCSVDAAGPTAKFSAVDCASDFSEGTLQAQIRSVVEAVLNESHFPWRAAEVAEQRKEQRRALKAFKQECRQRCTALEEKLRFALEAIESTGSSLAELRAGCFMAEAARSAAAETGCLASSPREQLFAQPSTRMNSPFAKATTKGASADSEQHLMDLVLRRTKRFTEACEERCVQRVALEITQPLAEHVRRLISAHQSMVDTVVESRCEQLEGRITRTLQQQQMQLKELGSRLGGLRSDVQSALRDLSEKLDVACPGL